MDDAPAGCSGHGRGLTPVMARTDRSALRQRQLEDVVAGAREAAPAVEVDRTAVVRLHDDLQPDGTLRDRVALRVVDELPADALVLVPRADEELLDPDDVAVVVQGDVARAVAF